MKPEKIALANTLIKSMGVTSVAALAPFSTAEIYQQNCKSGHECNLADLQALHAEAKKDYNDLRIMEKSVLTRASPLLPDAIRLGLKHPDVSVQDYGDWFGNRAAYYARPGEVSSMFSPAAYLTELYRNARALYPESSVWHIDTRRPDLATLALSQENMTSEVMALTLSNEILMDKTRNQMMKNSEAESLSDDEVLQELSTHVTSSETPYHLHHNRLRMVRLLKDPDFRQMASVPQVISHLSDATLAGVYYNIPPVLYELLTEEIPKDEAGQKAMFGRNFGENLSPEAFLNPQMLRSWYGLTDEEVRGFLGNLTGEPEYIDNVLTTRLNNQVVRLSYTGKNSSSYVNYARFYPLGNNKWKVVFSLKVSNVVTIRLSGAVTKSFKADHDFGVAELLPGEQYSTVFDWEDEKVPSDFTINFVWVKNVSGGTHGFDIPHAVQTLPVYIFLLKLNKAIRLYKATGLSSHVLEDIVNSVNPDQITDETLTLLFRTALLMQRYHVSHEEALVMSKGLLSLSSRNSEMSQFDRVFNAPPLLENGFYPGIKDFIYLIPEKADEDADIKAALKRAFRTDDEGMSALWLIYASTETNHKFYLNTKEISGVYAISLWARAFSLTPLELLLLLRMAGLPAKLWLATVGEWNALFERAGSILEWLRDRAWTVHDMALMTRNVDVIPPGTDISNLLASLRSAALATELPENPAFEDYARPLMPALAAALALPGDAHAHAHALLNWADRAKPGDTTLSAFWNILINKTPDVADIRAATSFTYALAQMAQIVHASGVTAQALALFVKNPTRLSATATSGATLARQANVVIALCRFSDWLRTLPDPTGAGASVVSSLQANTLTPSLLSQATGLPVTTVVQAVAEANKKGDVANAAKLSSWQEISAVREWLALAKTFGVMPSDVGRMVELNYQTGTTASTWADWKRVADVFMADLTKPQQRSLEEDVAARLSGALSGYLLAAQLLPGGSSGREALFTYLLSDNLNGPQMKTSRLAEAIASLQAFIHRVLSLSPLDPENEGVVREVFDRQFFRDWVQWNDRYTTWAAGQKLMYYPENYIDPTVRLGQTRMMDDMLQVLGQAQINTDTVGDAFMGYLTGFEEVANLETVSGYHDSANQDEGKTWFVGRNQSTPPEYWWRSVDEGRRSAEGVLPANAWTGWSKIATSPQPTGKLIRPVVYKDRLYVGWVERNRYVLARNEEGEETLFEYRWELKLSWLRYDGGWSQPAVYTYPATAASELNELLEMTTHSDGLSLYLSSWPEKELMIAGIYKKDREDGDKEGKSFKGEVLIYEDMTFEETKFASSNWPVLKDMLDDADISSVLLPFFPGFISIENTLTSSSELPSGFSRFDATNMQASVIDVSEAGDTYRLRIGCTQVVDMYRPEVVNKLISYLLNYYPELQTETGKVRVLYGKDDEVYSGALIVRQEGNQWWGYLLTTNYWGNWPNLRISDGSLSFEDSSELIRDTNAPGKSPHSAKFKIGDGTYPFEYMVFKSYENGEEKSQINARVLLGDNLTKAVLEAKITPSAYVSPPGIIPRNQITSQVSGGQGDTSIPYVLGRDVDLSTGSATLTWSSNPYPAAGDKYFTFSNNEVIHTLRLSCGNNKVRTWNFRVYKESGELKIDTIGMEESAQYLEHSGTRTRLNTLFARQLTEKASSGIDSILNFETQLLPEPPLKEGDGDGVMDFSGANAIYFWELFYYTPMMVMQRFLQEERFDLAEKWLKYVFCPSGYTVHGMWDPRMWNVRPLQEDTSWNDEPLKSYDPDAVAQNDPMHYKLNAFMRLLDITIGRGDAAYRKLERDTLAEAKVWYGRALSLLGEAPWIEPGAGWTDPLLGITASDSVLNDRIDALSQLAKGIRRTRDIPLSAISGVNMFLPEANEEMLQYWEVLRIRLYNLRHNLTLDGQPLNLPLFAAPADPKAMLASAVAAQGGPGSELPSVPSIPVLRFTPMLESARSMASQLIQFGSSMQQILMAQDAEALSELLVTQGTGLAAGSLSLQKQVLEELAAERTTLEKALDTITMRHNHYKNLYEQNINARETQAMDLLTSSQSIAAGAKGLHMAAAAAGIAPNIFGLANGGMKYDGPLNAAGIGITIAADGLSIAGSRMAQEEQFRRRREEWDIQYHTAEKEMQGIEAQLNALSVRETSARMQIDHMMTQEQHMKAQLALFQSKYTSKAMYSWLRGRLATIFYQYYDLTASLCLMAQKSLQWEKGDTTSYLKTGTWNGAWAGLMSGEGLMLSLAQMEMAWMKHQKRELEVTRTVSLAALLNDKLDENTLPEALKLLLESGNGFIGTGKNKVDITDKQLGVHFSLKDLNLMGDYASGRVGRIRSIAVTLPGLLGPYQNIRGQLSTNTDIAKLPAGCNECAISYAMQDNGLFVNDGSGDPRWGARWLPFEGLDAKDDSGMTLSFADATGDQKSLLESLSDIILHVQFTVR